MRAQEWSEEACRYIGKRVEDIKYEFNSRDYTELWRVLDELERICLEEALKDPLRRDVYKRQPLIMEARRLNMS